MRMVTSLIYLMNKTQLLEYIKHHLIYESERGEFVWENAYHSSRNGTVAGTYDEYGYRVLKIKGKVYKIHHLVWLVENGELPEMINHKNRVRDDNKIENL